MSKDENKYQHESLLQKEAFEYYYAMGDKRDINKVSTENGGEIDRTVRTIYEWSRRFDWVERVKQRDIEIGKKLEKKTNTTIVNEKAKYRKIIQASIGRFVQDLQEGKVKIRTISDFEKIVKLDLLLMGEADSIQKVESTTSLVLTERDKAEIKHIAESVNSIRDREKVVYDEE